MNVQKKFFHFRAIACYLPDKTGEFFFQFIDGKKAYHKTFLKNQPPRRKNIKFMLLQVWLLPGKETNVNCGTVHKYLFALRPIIHYRFSHVIRNAMYFIGTGK